MIKLGLILAVSGLVFGSGGCDNDNGSDGFSKGSGGENTVQTDGGKQDTASSLHETDLATTLDTSGSVGGELPAITGECDGTVSYIKAVPSQHLGEGEPAVFASHPPTSGPHYWALAKWGAYDVSVEAGNWVHNLEHGGVVLLYRPGANADAYRSTLIQVATDTPADPKCNGVNEACQRVIVAPDDNLPSGVAVAAVAWEYLYTAQCASETDLRAFIDARYAQAPENFCNGTSYLPAEATLTTFGPCPDTDNPVDIPPIHGDTSEGNEDIGVSVDAGNLAPDGESDGK